MAILRGIQKNEWFDIFGDQTTRIVISNLNSRQPNQQTHMLKLSLPPPQKIE
jgi:hypothetical protein